jgi:hypothetical protein
MISAKAGDKYAKPVLLNISEKREGEGEGEGENYVHHFAFLSLTLRHAGAVYISREYRVGRAVQAKKTAFCGFFQKKRAPLYLVVAQRQTTKSSAAMQHRRAAAQHFASRAQHLHPSVEKVQPPPSVEKVHPSVEKVQPPLRGKSSA